MRRREASRCQGRNGYPSVEAFYNADERRIASRELDVGLWWREEIDGPLHRAAWIEETGELYLVRSGLPETGGGGVEVLASAESQERVDEVLHGWRERCGEPRSLPWLRERAARLDARVRRPLLGRAGGVGPVPV